MTLQLTSTQRRFLKQQAHHLKPVVQMGKDGLGGGFLQEVDNQLAIHELIKIRVLNNCLSGDDEIHGGLAQIDATFVQRVGNVWTVFKKKPKESRFRLPRD